jgi:ribosome-associated protein
VSNAVHLCFDVAASHLPDPIKARLLALDDRRITREGVIVIKAQRHRSLERNYDDALARLSLIVDAAAVVPATRKPTRPTRASQQRRVEAKVQRGRIKAARGRVDDR